MIKFTNEAFKRVTYAQKVALADMMNERETAINCSVDFSLPEGYIYFVKGNPHNNHELHGGVSPDGDVST